MNTDEMFQAVLREIRCRTTIKPNELADAVKLYMRTVKENDVFIPYVTEHTENTSMDIWEHA